MTIGCKRSNKLTSQNRTRSKLGMDSANPSPKYLFSSFSAVISSSFKLFSSRAAFSEAVSSDTGALIRAALEEVWVLGRAGFCEEIPGRVGRETTRRDVDVRLMSLAMPRTWAAEALPSDWVLKFGQVNERARALFA